MPVHQVADSGFDAEAASYERSRPSDPPDCVAWFVEHLGIAPGRTVLDLAAGTGKLTRLLEPAGARLIAAEPVDGMRAVLRATSPAVPLVSSTAEQLPFASGSLDAIVVAQAFHWFDFQAALSELARVLGPDGVLVLVWNARDASVPWVDELTRLVEQRTGGRPYDDHREVSWSEVVAASGRFGPLDERRYPNPIPTTLDGVIDRLRSTSFVAVLDDAERAVLLDAARDLLAGHPELVGTFAYPHHTIVHAARLAHR